MTFWRFFLVFFGVCTGCGCVYQKVLRAELFEALLQDTSRAISERKIKTNVFIENNWMFGLKMIGLNRCVYVLTCFIHLLISSYDRTYCSIFWNMISGLSIWIRQMAQLWDPPIFVHGLKFAQQPHGHTSDYHRLFLSHTLILITFTPSFWHRPSTDIAGFSSMIHFFKNKNYSTTKLYQGNRIKEWAYQNDINESLSSRNAYFIKNKTSEFVLRYTILRMIIVHTNDRDAVWISNYDTCQVIAFLVLEIHAPKIPDKWWGNCWRANNQTSPLLFPFLS